MASGISSGQKPTGVTDLDSVQTLENKTLDSSSAVNGAPITGSDIISPTRADVKKDVLSALQTYALTASNGQLCYATDVKKMYQVLDAALAEVGSGQGGINYISNPDFELNADGWVSDANLTIARSTSSPLRGDASGLISKGAVDASGEVVKTIPFTIDSADLAKKLYISADVDASDANYADGDLRWKIVKDPNGTPVTIRPNAEDILGGNFSRLAWFQSDATITEYELQIECNSANASAYSVKIDNVSVGPRELAYGTSLATQTITATSGQNTLILTKTPTGLEFDTSLFTDEGSSLISYATASSRTTFTALQDCSVFVMLTGLAASGVNIELYKNGTRLTRSADPSANNTFSSLTSMIDLDKDDTFYFTVDTSTLSSSTAPASINIHASSSLDAIMSEDIGNRDVRVRGAGNSGAAITANTEAIDFTLVEDTTGSWSQEGVHGPDTFTAPETGNYIVTGMVYYTSAVNITIDSYINGTIDKRLGFDATSTNYQKFDGVVTLEKGDALTIRSNSLITLSNLGNQLHWIHIQKLAQPQTLLETETVAARYTSISGQAITTSYSTLIYETKVADTHNAYDISTGIYTTPVSGWYQLNARGKYNTSSTGNVRYMRAVVDGTVECDWTSGSDSFTSTMPVDTIIYLEKGQELLIETKTQTSSFNLSTGSGDNIFSIARIK